MLRISQFALMQPVEVESQMPCINQNITPTDITRALNK